MSSELSLDILDPGPEMTPEEHVQMQERAARVRRRLRGIVYLPPLPQPQADSSRQAPPPAGEEKNES